jgi:glycosyltransferase A (GT-A) superfamily protein (DUF2064 family)
VVIGPAEDGGYLLGLKETILLFSKTKTGEQILFFKATMKDLKGHQISLWRL